MKNRVIGFVGLDVQDTVLYLSRIFHHMGKSVLMADYSGSQALYYCIPMIPGTDAYTTLVEYRGTYFTSGPIREKDYENFDVIMIFFGFEERREVRNCTHMIYTTDGEKNHVERLKEIKGGYADYSQIVFRNAGRTQHYMEDVKRPFYGAVREACAYSCNDSGKEKRLRIQCQYNEVFSFRGISARFKKYLFETVRAVFPEESGGKEFEECFKRAQQGD